MATVANQPGIDEDKNKEGVDLGAPAPTIGGGTAPSSGGVASAAASTPGAITGGEKAATSSGSYSDVGRYLKANKPRIGQYANQIAGKVSNKVNEASAATQDEVTEKQEEIDAARLPGTDFYEGRDVTDLDVGKSQDLLGGQWGGPSAEDVALSTLSGLEGARDLANLSGSYSGSKELIGQTMQPTGGRYTRGMTSLGAASLQGDATARGTLGQSREAAESAYTRGVESENTLQDNVEQGIEANKQAGENFAKWLSNTASDIGDNPAQAQAARSKAIEDQMVEEIIRLQNLKKEQGVGALTQRELDTLNALSTYMHSVPIDWREQDAYAGKTWDQIVDDGRRHAAREAMANSGFSTLTSGQTAEDIGRLNAIKNIIAGSGRNDIANKITSGISSGTYDQKSSTDRLLEWLSGGDMAGVANHSQSNTLPSGNNSTGGTLGEVLDTMASIFG